MHAFKSIKREVEIIELMKTFEIRDSFSLNYVRNISNLFVNSINSVLELEASQPK